MVSAARQSTTAGDPEAIIVQESPIILLCRRGCALQASNPHYANADVPRERLSSLAGAQANHFLSLLAVLLALVPQARSQTTQPCRSNGPLTEAQVLAAVRGRTAADQVAASIMSCHVSFDLDPATLDRLVGEKTPAPVMEALNEDTVLRLTLAAAHSEAASIEAYLRADADGAGGVALPALSKLNAEFQAKRMQQVAAKGEFETEPDYRDRVRRSQIETKLLEIRHKAQLAEYYAAFASRIRFLRTTSYPIAAESVYVSYDADRQQLVVRTNGKEYLYWGVEPDVARSFKENWQNVQTGLKYNDDGSRLLFLSAAGRVC
jgi:hypothetical protein